MQNISPHLSTRIYSETIIIIIIMKVKKFHKKYAHVDYCFNTVPDD